MKKHNTLMNKLIALQIFILGVASTFIDGDATACIFLSMISIYLFFEKESIIG